MLNKVLYGVLAISLIINIAVGVSLGNITQEIKVLKILVTALESDINTKSTNYLEAMVSSLESRVRDLERSGENLFRMDLPILLARNHKSHRRTGGNCLSCFKSPGGLY